MVNPRVYAKQMDVARATDDTWVALRATRDGSAIVMPWYQALVLEGRVFQGTASAVIAEITPATTYADASGTLGIDIPDGSAAIPLKCEVTVALTTAGNEVYFFTSRVLNAVGNGTTVTPRNLRVDNPLTTRASVEHTITTAGDTVTQTEVMLHSVGPMTLDIDAVGISPRIVDWSVGLHCVAPVIIDAGSINVTLVDGTGTARVDCNWAEFAESVFK